MPKKIQPRHRSDEPGSVRLSSSGWYLKVLGTWMDNQLSACLGPLGLTLSQFAILMTLLEQEGLTQAEIGQRAMLPGYATTRHIDKLESRGFVKRWEHETSRRSNRILLTEAGKALAPDLYRATNTVNKRFLSTLEEEQKAELLKILTVVTSELGLLSQD